MTDPNDPLGILGTTVAEKYRILSVAGEGGFSTVYKAEHLIWNQPVAIKFFNILEEAEAKMRERLLQDFVQEGKLMSQLSSKSAAIVQARDIGKLARPSGAWIPYMVLEWLEGEPLDAVLHRELVAGMPPRNLQEVMALLEPAVQALDIAHKAGVAHRDLKPANLMVLGDPRGPDALVKVLDFGIAKVMAEHGELHQQLQMTGAQITAFTPNHGAPEQFSRNYGATGPWTDVFAMALIMVEMLRGGQRALAGDSFFELGVSSCDPNRRPTPASFGIAMPVEIDAIFARALAVQPSDRFASMAEFWAALHRFVYPGQETWRAPGRPSTTSDPRAMAFMQDATMPQPPQTAHAMAGIMPAPARGGNGKVALAVVGVMAIGGGAATFALLGSDDAPVEAPAAPTSEPTATPAPTPTGAEAVAWKGPCPDNMKAVPGGKFRMGSDEPGFPLWKPAHEVTIDSFCLAVHEVTVDEYARCVDEGGCKPADTAPSYPKAESQTDEEHEQGLKAYAELCNWEKPQRGDHPINCLDWYRADAYCKHLGQRLPTEAEWELAARGTDGRKFPWGNDTGNETYMNAAGTEWKAWLADHDLPAPQGLMYEADDGYPGTAPVGKFPRAQTQAGQMDMVGNVWEWTNDWYALYKDEAQVNPKGPAAGDRKAIRGGGFNGEFALWINPAARFHQLATASVHAVGFRCASNVREAE